jgi:hypothetical protein
VVGLAVEVGAISQLLAVQVRLGKETLAVMVLTLLLKLLVVVEARGLLVATQRQMEATGVTDCRLVCLVQQ